MTTAGAGSSTSTCRSALCARWAFWFSSARPATCIENRSRFRRVFGAEPGHRRLAIDARSRPNERLVPFERNLDRGDGRWAWVLPICRTHGDHRRALVSQPRFVEERQFRGGHAAGVLWRADADWNPGAAADNAAKPDELSGADHRACDYAARHRQHGGDVSRRAIDRPYRQPAAHSVRPSACRGRDEADELLFAADGHGTGRHRRAVLGLRPRL